MSPAAALISASFCRRVLKQSYFLHRHHRRRLHSVIEYPLTHPIYTIWASNTSLGKTLVSAGLSMSFLSSSSAPFPRKRFVYVKPIQTGFPDDSDSRFVYRKFSEFFTYKPLPFSVFASNSVLKASSPAANAVLRNGMAGGSLRTEAFGAEVVEKGGNIGGGIENVHWYEERKMRGSESNETELFPASQIVCKTMYAWKEAVSPHLAAEREEAMVGDSEVLHMLKRCLGNGLIGASCNTEELEVMCVIETAGGVASPGPSGSLQCDLYRNSCGGWTIRCISGTISAYESLKLRGYDVAAVIFEDHGLVNEVPLLSYFRNRVPVFVLPSIPTDMSDDLMSWFDKSQMIFTSLKEIMLSDFRKRMQRVAIGYLNNLMPVQVGGRRALMLTCRGFGIALDSLTLGKDIYFIIRFSGDITKAVFFRRLQIELARDMGYTAARYGHASFFLYYDQHSVSSLCSLNGWASRVYFSDNGSTAVEIALKMAFRKFLSDNKVLLDLVDADVNGRSMDLKVLWKLRHLQRILAFFSNPGETLITHPPTPTRRRQPHLRSLTFGSKPRPTARRSSGAVSSRRRPRPTPLRLCSASSQRPLSGACRLRRRSRFRLPRRGAFVCAQAVRSLAPSIKPTPAARAAGTDVLRRPWPIMA
ncbi:Bifunctional dethiobiotin synthetase/7,8-diamino-pelargonic acid aminotransferase, mitochondrial [Sesamum angolense]|uniref:Bifunctional dethiobiotin synthetase/7,8-diamino-pelargonic acid aminotransferase, mitochondrial n=1 Tax=Sesamum angolense TaxID=2727404 RepID=A0AAE1X4F0_9LAMI|nr:Bifunctional dethiobiotin synthetase/7,8-diamino-pelargonic acid aminotransferase, mitochondrial [Sesamum angolense]